ncbi:MAG: phospholipase D-like domain-containing protein [Micropepsaceae bacterium]
MLIKDDPERLLAEVEELIKSMPSDGKVMTSRDYAPWVGQLKATITASGLASGVALPRLVDVAGSSSPPDREKAVTQILAMLYEARHGLLMLLGRSSPTSVTIKEGGVFDYFDELTKRIKLAKQELFFVDPYMDDPNFIARYLPQISDGVVVRLLTQNKAAAMVPAVQTYMAQNKTKIELREGKFHDRYLIIDRKIAFQSGASFKDGGKSPTALIEIVDLFPEISKQCEALWAAATVLV